MTCLGKISPDDIFGVTVRQDFQLETSTVIVGAEGPEMLTNRVH